MKPLSGMDSRGRFQACFTKPAQPDYKGVLRGGRAVVFEAKHTDGDTIAYNRLTETQMDCMEQVLCSVIGFFFAGNGNIIICFGFTQEIQKSFYLLPLPITG